MQGFEPLLEAFVKATLMVLGTSCGEVKTEYQRADGAIECGNGDIVGLMGMAGRPGLTVAVAFPSSLAGTLVSLMSGEGEEELEAVDVDDGVSELLNMICGNAKALLNRDGYELQLSVPTIIRTSEYKIAHHQKVSAVGASFKLLDQIFEVRLIAAMHDLTGMGSASDSSREESEVGF